MTLAHVAAPSPAPPAATASAPFGGSLVSAAPAPPVQASSVAAPSVVAPVLGPTATPVIQRIDTSAPAPAPSGPAGERSDDELDNLARALFGRFRNRLRDEYIYEREAKGLTFDHS